MVNLVLNSKSLPFDFEYASPTLNQTSGKSRRTFRVSRRRTNSRYLSAIGHLSNSKLLEAVSSIRDCYLTSGVLRHFVSPPMTCFVVICRDSTAENVGIDRFSPCKHLRNLLKFDVELAWPAIRVGEADLEVGAAMNGTVKCSPIKHPGEFIWRSRYEERLLVPVVFEENQFSDRRESRDLRSPRAARDCISACACSIASAVIQFLFM